ncbi:hypothetical protein Rsub_08495 [Raphidocelis subcapitata]|uniref:Uncharacterized protein n=1 Tax=Raphidocelis subcapitata TaxID=307507 RepID=A0A2V0P7Q7_9CHLO|nr:hypothetical protein Rsub_08495 [Raphidocelis subcapitata]|eukprot:GBF95904.1 hypothetical protein Rsub_08495 [Raphidocelis subcapitata]
MFKTVIAKLRKVLAARQRLVGKLAAEQRVLRARAAAAGLAARQAAALSELAGLLSSGGGSGGGGTTEPGLGLAEELRALQNQLGGDGGGGGADALGAPIGWDPRAAAAAAGDYDVASVEGVRRAYASIVREGVPLVARAANSTLDAEQARRKLGALHTGMLQLIALLGTAAATPRTGFQVVIAPFDTGDSADSGGSARSGGGGGGSVQEGTSGAASSGGSRQGSTAAAPPADLWRWAAVQLGPSPEQHELLDALLSLFRLRCDRIGACRAELLAALRAALGGAADGDSEAPPLPEEAVEGMAALQREELLVWVVFDLAVVCVLSPEQCIRWTAACLPHIPTLLELEAGLAALGDRGGDKPPSGRG